ncbi:MAG: hypothetical protein MUC36_12950 [Planctomycetes bacterium]|nr:hypothetical protein [Planctomycetota bacterium]
MNAARSFRAIALGSCLLLHLQLGGCIASNVVAPDQRLVAATVEQIPFQPAGVVQLDGLYESIDIQGDAAVSLRKIYYLFVAGGTYTAAALAEVDGVPQFQTLNGSWQATADGLVLDGADPVPLAQAPDHLRLAAPTGTVVLRKVVLQ